MYVHAGHGVTDGLDAVLTCDRVIALAKDLLAYDLGRDRERMIDIATR